MAEPQTASIRTLIQDVITDAGALVREEVTLARTEIREQASEAKWLAMRFAAAVLLALVAITLVFVALAAALAQLFGLPAWAAFAGLGVLVALISYLVLAQGRSALREMQVLPKTRSSMQENIAWIQSKSSSR